MRKRAFWLLAAVALPLFVAPARADISDDAPTATQSQSDYLMVSFKSPPAASYEGGIPGLARTKPVVGRLDPSSPAYQAYQRHLQNERANFHAFLRNRAPQAQVVREYFGVLNAVAVKLNGTNEATVRNGPGAQRAAFSSLYRPAMNVSNDLIRSSEVWGQLGGAPSAGSGVRVAVIDTGIDLTNRFFSDAGLPTQIQIDECDDQDNDPATPDTNNKVAVCRVFTSGIAPGPPGGDEELCVDHGTHVAGTVGGRAGTSGTVAETDVVLSDLSGVAPGVVLGNYNVFPCVGAGFIAFDGSAFSHDIAAAMEAALADGMHVVNMSLGGTVQGPHDL